MSEQNETTYLNSPYGQHLLNCAEVANAICDKYGVHDDSARQACFATVLIDAKDHFIFVSDAEKDRRGAEKADAQIKEIDPNPTAEKADAVLRAQLLEKIESARNLLNTEGHDPQITPGGLNALVKQDFDVESLDLMTDTEMLSQLLEKLSKRLDVLRSAKKPTSELASKPPF